MPFRRAGMKRPRASRGGPSRKTLGAQQTRANRDLAAFALQPLDALRCTLEAGSVVGGEKDPVAVSILPGATSPTTLWSEHIRRRQPAIIDGHPTDAEWQADKWTHKYIDEKAGSCPVFVEVREDVNEQYGRGRKKKMTFSEFLSRSRKNQMLYLTPQRVHTAVDGHPAVWAEPLTSLIDDIPVRPKLLGELVPQQINLWIGNAPDGSSSGLHHDFHDNLYVLLRGRKRFKLFPPTLSHELYPRGKISRIHSNGRIVYGKSSRVAADGSDAVEVDLWRRRRAAEGKLAEAQRALAAGEAGAEDCVEEAERELDDLLDQALEGGGWDAGDEFETFEEEEEGSEQEAPDSFSQIDLALSPDALRHKFPKFRPEAAIECEVRSGQSLYLPAGWWHEVTSYSEPDSNQHIALNYWVHPPDRLEAESQHQPYSSDYWPTLWSERHVMLAKHREDAGQQENAAGGARLAPKQGKMK